MPGFYGHKSFYSSPLTVTAGVGPKINIYCDDTQAITLAEASQFYLLPANPTYSNQGIIEGLVEKMLHSGIDPYLTIPITFTSVPSPPVYPSSLNFYHGLIQANFGFNFDLSLGTQTNTNAYDAYTVFQHEIFHLLGFLSLINSDGYSKFGQASNYFSRYDQFLQDNNGQPLLASLTGTCMNSGLSYVAPLSAIATVTTGCINDVTTCSNAARYAGNTYTVPVYTPNCFEPSSSLSHFEDMCIFQPTTSLCPPSPPSPGANNLYFLMSSSNDLGPCYMKRFLKEEERSVLCDIGYTVSYFYNSNAAVIENGLNYHVYSAGTCSPSNISGINDGVVNGVYIYTTTGTSISIPTASILLNDIPSTGLSVSCVEVIYYNASNNFSAAVSGTNLVVTGNAGSGLALIKYLPKNGSNVFGNATYVYVYFLSNNCSPATACNLVQNPDFENLNSSVACGPMFFPSGPVLSCWDVQEGIPSVVSRSCTSSGGMYDLGVNTIGTSPTVLNSFNGSGNNRVVTLYHTYTTGNPLATQAIKNNLGTPLIPGTPYQLSLFANNSPSNFSSNNTFSLPVVLTVATNSAFAFSPSGNFPAGLNVVAEFTIPANTSWTQWASSFTFNSPGSLQHSALIIGINAAKTYSVANPGTPTYSPSVWCYLDEISIYPMISPVFSIPSTTICGNAALPDLAQYVSIPGTFSGQYVSLSPGMYNFNSPAVALSPGVYPIAFNYTANGCNNTVYQTVTVSSNTNYVFIPTTNLCTTPTTLDLSALITNTNYISTTTLTSGGNTVSALQNYTTVGTYTYSALNNTPGLCNTAYTFAVNVYNIPSVPDFTTNVYPSGFSGYNTSTLCANRSMTLSATSTASFVTWQPGNLSGHTQTLNPAVTTIYTVSAFNHSSCSIFTNTFEIVVFPNCCNSSSIAVLSTNSITTSTVLNGPLLVASDFTVQPGISVLMSGEIRFADNTGVVVENSSTLTLQYAHLLACESTMWKGIILKDGAAIGTTTNTLIEDAITAIDVSNHTSSLLNPILNLNMIVFNKNFTDINIANYQRTSSSYSTAFNIRNCVFTCRSLTYTPGAWPIASAADLRAAVNPTTGLASPFLVGIPQATLLAPYAGQTSSVAIKLNAVGITTNNVYYGIALGNSIASEFNLFDYHHTFIQGVNSNLSCANSVFQNTKSTAATAGNGSAIHFVNTSGFVEQNLDLRAPNINIGNRFWNCHRGVQAKNIYLFTMDYAVFRSTQSSTNTAFTHGNTGIVLNTNRFKYYMSNNEFTNINSCINVPIAAGVTNLTALTCSVCPNYGIYASNISITRNNFSRGSGSNNYLNRSITITAPNQGLWAIAGSPNVSPYIVGTIIENNRFNNVFNGISISGIKNFQTRVNINDITMVEDNVFLLAQRGIELNNTIDNFIGQSVITENKVKSSGSTTLTNNLASLIYCGNNMGTGLQSPSVTCNEIKNAYHGFVFDSWNQGARWMGNTMEGNARGMMLSNNGEIGQQGNPTLGFYNLWYGSWTGTNYGIYTYNSNPQASPLYAVGTTTPSYPINLSGVPTPSIYISNVNPIVVTSGDSYHCYSPTAIITNPSIPDVHNYFSSELYYIAKTALYRFLHANDSIRNSDITLSNFYSGLTGTSISGFVAIEDYLSAGDLVNADIELRLITSTNAIETNYIEYYTLYIKYAGNSFGPTDDMDRIALNNLASMCPGMDGACVYQARSLYNYVFNEALSYPVCGGSGARYGILSEDIINKNCWKIALYPNPAINKINLTSNKENEVLDITITDLSGRMLARQQVKVNNFITTLELNLRDGVYLVHITNDGNNTLVKKLLIAK